MVELEQVKRFRLETLPGHEVVPGTSRGIHKKHTRSKRGGHGFYTYRSSLQVSFWHLFKIYLRLIFPFSIFFAIGSNFIRGKVNKTAFTSPGDEYYTIGV